MHRAHGRHVRLDGQGRRPAFSVAVRHGDSVHPRPGRGLVPGGAPLAEVHWVYRQWIGGWAGRAVAAELARTRPDVVVSTYPLATAGLGWLSGQGRVGIPSAAVLSDFAPHPFWVYPGIDRYFVLSDTARDSIGGSPPAPRSWSVPRRLRPASLLPAATRS